MANQATSTPRPTRRPSRSARLVTLAAVAVASASTWAAPAKASIAYAYLLASEFDFGGGCPACHTNEAGGLGTVTKPFGKTMMKYGLVANDTESLYDAVVTLSTSNDDSDGDTISDFDELSPDGNPNDPTVFPEGATPVPAAPTTPAPTTTAPTTTAPSTAPSNTTTTDSSNTPTPTTTPTPSATQSPAPAPATSPDDGGCSLVGGNLARPNGSSLSAVALGLLGLGFVSRRRRGE